MKTLNFESLTNGDIKNLKRDTGITKSLDMENVICKYFSNRMIEQGWSKEPVDEFSPADLVMSTNWNNQKVYGCVEVKSRVKYDLEFFKKYGMSCETSKLVKCQNKYNVNSLQLITVTSDGYVLIGYVDYSTKRKIYQAKKTTQFKNNNLSNKEFYVVEKFQVYHLKYNVIESIVK
ncbi:MAG: hypothetical protein ACRCX2_14910 [Paraclostridium sp.]